MTRPSEAGATIARRSPETLSRWEPWSEFRMLQHEMDNLFNNMIGYAPFSRFPIDHGAVSDAIHLSPDVYETDNELVIILPVPGIDPNELNVEATADTLNVRGEMKPFFQKESTIQHRRSLWSAGQGTFHWSYALPVEVDAGRINANCRNGLLELRLPKSEASRSKAVKVNVAGR